MTGWEECVDTSGEWYEQSLFDSEQARLGLHHFHLFWMFIRKQEGMSREVPLVSCSREQRGGAFSTLPPTLPHMRTGRLVTVRGKGDLT